MARNIKWNMVSNIIINDWYTEPQPFMTTRSWKLFQSPKEYRIFLHRFAGAGYETSRISDSILKLPPLKTNFDMWKKRNQYETISYPKPLLSTISIKYKYIELLPSTWKNTDRRCLESFELQLFPPEKVAALSRSIGVWSCTIFNVWDCLGILVESIAMCKEMPRNHSTVSTTRAQLLVVWIYPLGATTTLWIFRIFQESLLTNDLGLWAHGRFLGQASPFAIWNSKRDCSLRSV